MDALILGAYGIAAKLFTDRIPRIFATTFIVTSFDVVLDPGAVLLGFWHYKEGGWFYGVPISNFAGWLVSGLIGTILLELLVVKFKPLLPTPVQLASSDLHYRFLGRYRLFRFAVPFRGDRDADLCRPRVSILPTSLLI